MMTTSQQLRRVAEISRILTNEMIELLGLREAVRRAKERVAGQHETAKQRDPGGCLFGRSGDRSAPCENTGDPHRDMFPPRSRGRG